MNTIRHPDCVSSFWFCFEAIASYIDYVCTVLSLKNYSKAF